MNHQNYIPYEITADFCEAEEKIVDILMTYTKNRKQEPHPLYYKAVTKAAQQMFIRFEDALAEESFGDFEDAGKIYELSLDVRELDQLGIASYIEAQMLAPKLGEYFSSLNAYGEKIAIRYGFFEEEPDELQAVTALLKLAAVDMHRPQGPAPEHIRQFARFVMDVLDKRMKETASWNPDIAEEFFEELNQLQPAWAWRDDWNIVALDLYEWFCLKNNLTFYQFPALYPKYSDTEFRIGVYALRYPSEQNKFTEILACLQKFAQNHPGNRALKTLDREDDLFAQIDALEPVEKLAGMEMMYRGDESNREYHKSMLGEVLLNLVRVSNRHPFHTIPDEDELCELYDEICRVLGTSPVMTEDEIRENCWNGNYSGGMTTGADEKTDEYFDSYLQKWVKDQDEDKIAWILKTTLDSYADCLESGQTVDEICTRITPEADVSDDSHRAELFARLQKELNNAFEPKLANHVAYAIFVRLTADAYHETPAELFNLQLAVARHVFTDSEYCSRLPEIPDHLQAVAACTRTIFPDDPLIANQLASKICCFAEGICEQESLNPVAHHYYLAGGIRHLLECARSACDTSGPTQRIARLHGYNGDHVYATDLAVIDTLYRAVCTGYLKQPCVDIERVI